MSIKVFSFYFRMYKGYNCRHQVNVAGFEGHGGSLLRMGSRCLLDISVVQLLGLGAVGALLLALQVGVGLEGRLSGGAVGGVILSGI